MFNYDWFHGPGYQQQLDEAKWRCTNRHFPELERKARTRNKKVQEFESLLETRTLIYLRDGFSYEMKEIPELTVKSHLVFECVPVDEHYKVGAFVVTVPFEEIVRVEVYAVHPSERPGDSPQITGFRNYEPHDRKFVEPGMPPGGH